MRFFLGAQPCDPDFQFECIVYDPADLLMKPKCIPLSRKCDGVINCFNGSDEAHHLCHEPIWTTRATTTKPTTTDSTSTSNIMSSTQSTKSPTTEVPY